MQNDPTIDLGTCDRVLDYLFDNQNLLLQIREKCKGVLGKEISSAIEEQLCEIRTIAHEFKRIAKEKWHG